MILLTALRLSHRTGRKSCNQAHPKAVLLALSSRARASDTLILMAISFDAPLAAMLRAQIDLTFDCRRTISTSEKSNSSRSVRSRYRCTVGVLKRRFATKIEGVDQ
jgi:hypothetical protein